MKPLGVSLETAGMVPKKTPVVFTPKYTPKLSINPINWLQRAKWNIKDERGNILYTFAPGFSPARNGIIITSSLGTNLTATFMNSEKYLIEPEDTTLTLMGALPDKKSLTIQVKSRSASSIVNKGAQKIRKEDLIHLEASGIKFDYGIAGLGNRAFWHIQKDSGRTVSLGLRVDVKMTAPQLIQEFRNHQEPINDPYGNYKFQING